MDAPHLLLFGSVMLNVLLFRWGVREYLRRRKYQKQNGALAEALEAVNHNRSPLVVGQGEAIGWILAMLIGMGVLVLFSLYI